jgi:alanine or glycine:cation symporter, AGCS family
MTMGFARQLALLRDLIWGPPFLLLLLGTGLYLTIRLRGLQFRYLGRALRLVLKSPAQKDVPGEISQFQALMTALAATIGIGNIAGVAIAVRVGGLGALFWMVIAALAGMATIYSEAFLAVRFRIRDRRGEMVGGPMQTLRQGCRSKTLAAVFAFAGIAAAFTTGNMVQANSMADVILPLMPVSRWLLGVGISLFVGLVLLGGIRKIGQVASILVPAMAALYLVGGLLILVLKMDQVPRALLSIVTMAFHPQAIGGGATGITTMMALRMGVARGLLASEAGLGSAPIAAAAAKTDQPARQALVSMTGAFFSVCIVCTITGLVLAVTGILEPQGTKTGVPLTIEAFCSVLPGGQFIVIIGALLFGYSTILGWAYYGEKCLEYLAGEKATACYRGLFTLAVILGAAVDIEIVWSLADISNACMALPNLIGLLVLGGLVARETVPCLRIMRAESA